MRYSLCLQWGPCSGALCCSTTVKSPPRCAKSTLIVRLFINVSGGEPVGPHPKNQWRRQSFRYLYSNYQTEFFLPWPWKHWQFVGPRAKVSLPSRPVQNRHGRFNSILALSQLLFIEDRAVKIWKKFNVFLMNFWYWENEILIFDMKNIEILILLFAIIVICDIRKIKIVIRDTGPPLLGP